MEKGDFFVVLYTTKDTIRRIKTPKFKVSNLTRLDWYLFHLEYECTPGQNHAEVQLGILIAMCETDPNLQVKQVSKMTDEEFNRMNDHVERAAAITQKRQRRR